MRLISLLILFFNSITLPAQTVTAKLEKAYRVFEADAQMKAAISSLYVIEAATGKVVFDKNSMVGLATASTHKTSVSITAYELLGADFIFETVLGYDGYMKGDTLVGNLILKGGGDPTLGSWRYGSTKEALQWKLWIKAIQDKGIRYIKGGLYADDSAWDSQTTPGGWTYGNLGNYFGAGVSALNWRENQFDVFFKTDKTIGSPAEIIRTNPLLHQVRLVSEVTAAATGTGDKTDIYLPAYSSYGVIRGTLPAGSSSFKVSGAFPNPSLQLLYAFADELRANDIEPGMVLGAYHTRIFPQGVTIAGLQPLHITHSPVLDSVIYWYNQKSINLYGEALLKAIGKGSTQNGVAALKKFWADKGIHSTELNVLDGSGLSTGQRVTTHAQVKMLQYAKDKPYYKAFYHSLPDYNNMKMKSGTINGVKGFCGYHKAKDGKEYIFSFLVNNYDGSSVSIVRKMYGVLDCLK